MPMPVKFVETEISGAFTVEVGCVSDDRGYFSEIYSETVWRAAGFTERFVQDNASLSRKGALRGMHYQLEPYGIGKLIRVMSGAIFDVGVDLRRGSPTFGRWIARTLSAENRLALYLPSGFAHGFLALEDNSLVYYKGTCGHVPEAERSLSYKDPAIDIRWPSKATLITKKDEDAPFLENAEYNFVFAEAAAP